MDLDRDVPAGATPAAYGKACSNCARAKCRCIYQADGPDCMRCQRLNKQCVPSVSLRKRTGRRLLASRTEKLEEKLDDLFSLIQNQKMSQQTPPENVNSNANLPSPPLVTPPSTGITKGSSTHPIIPHSTSYYTPSSSIKSVTNQSPTIEPEPTGTFEIYRTEAEANKDLNDFRTHMLNFFPYVYISPETTSEQLREQRPLVWMNIMCITCKNSLVQIKMARAIKTHVAMRVVVEHEASLDLLFGLITFVSWCHYNKKGKGFLGTMSGLISALVLDLGLTRAHKAPNLVTCIKQYHDTPMETGCGAPQRPRTVEDRRALLAAYYALSQASIRPKKCEGLAWTGHKDEALRALSEAPQYPGDQLLVVLVKLQLMAQEANTACWQSQQHIIPSLYISALQARIQEIKREIPDDMQNNNAVLSTLHYLDVVIQESKIDWKIFASPTKPDFSQYEALEGTVDSIQSWFDFYFSTAVESHIGMTFTIWCQFAHLILSLYRLTTMCDSGFHRKAIRSKIDVIAMCERMVASVESLIEIYNFQSGGNGECDEHIFAKFCRIIRSLRERWMTEVYGQDGPRSRDESEEQIGSEGFIDGIQSGPMALPLYPTDQTWFTDIFNVSWD